MIVRSFLLAALLGAFLAAASGDARADATANALERPAPRARDAGLNRVARLGAGFARGPASLGLTATASANVVSVVQSGAGNTVLLDVRQTNSGAVAAGALLNGRLDLD